MITGALPVEASIKATNVVQEKMMSGPNAETLLSGISTWVEIESQTADIAGVNRMMDRAATGFRQAGARVERLPGTNGTADHLSISSPWGGDGPGVLVLCHLDTVHPKGTLEQLPFRVEGDRAFGPGIYDMKGGAYLAYAAYRSIVEAGKTTPLPIRFLYTSDEEIGSLESRAHIEAQARNAKYVLVTEPARDGGKIVTARKGVARFVIEITGRPAHSGSRHADGRSAIVEMAHQILAIESMTDYARGITLNIGMVNGGTAANVIPAHCRASIDLRIASVADCDEIIARLKTLKPRNPDTTIKISGGLNRPPFEKNVGVERLYEHARGLAAELGFDLVDTYTGGGSDANFTAHLVPTLDGLGVDGNGAHTLEEHLLVSSLVPRMQLQRRLFETLS
ncbi:M20 family metallopeptidase [Leptospira interrogans]